MGDDNTSTRVKVAVADAPGSEPQLDGIQRLQQTLISTACGACISFLETGRIPGVAREGWVREFARNLEALKVFSEHQELVETAGFLDTNRVLRGIRTILSRAENVALPAQEVADLVGTGYEK